MGSFEDVIDAGSAIFGDVRSIFATLIDLGSSIVGSSNEPPE
ncbi:hypothetical protein ACFWPA_12185 [Rhodococcus sp. NPDC058505]